MPELSRFYGIVIKMYWNDHAPPHFHAQYGGAEAIIALESLEIIAGSLPQRAAKMVREWSELHHQELWEQWRRSRIPSPLDWIEPLP